MDIIRQCRFQPYRKGPGPQFGLTVWDTAKRDSRGQSLLGYRLTMGKNGSTIIVFEGEDFAGSPMHADDSDATLASLMNFLTLRPGDTDKQYFAAYTDVQREFCENHAEDLGHESRRRFGEG